MAIVSRIFKTAMGRGKADTRHHAPYLNDIDLGVLSESKSPSNKSNPRLSAGKMGGIVPHDHWDKAQVWTHLGRDIQANRLMRFGRDGLDRP